MLFLIIGFGLIGAIIGTWFFQFPGMVFGFAIGILAAWGKILSNRIAVLKKRIDAVMMDPNKRKTYSQKRYKGL